MKRSTQSLIRQHKSITIITTLSLITIIRNGIEGNSPLEEQIARHRTRVEAVA